MVAAGGMSIAFYTRREPHHTVTASNGLKIGVLAGMCGFLINAVLSTLGLLLPAVRNAAHAVMMDRWKEAMSRTSDPQALDTLRRFGDALNSPAGFAAMITLVLVVQAVLFVVFGGLGGAIGATLFGRRQEPEQQ
jgi:hypothetical protein